MARIWWPDSLGAFMTIRVLEGLLALSAYAAAPGLMMASSPPERRGRAMALWSTYSPLGTSLGLLLSGSFRRHRFLAWRLSAAPGAVCTRWPSPVRCCHKVPAAKRNTKPAGVFDAWMQSRTAAPGAEFRGIDRDRLRHDHGLSGMVRVPARRGDARCVEDVFSRDAC